MSMLEKVKANLGITGTFQDATIQGYIDEVQQFLLDGGIDRRIVNAESSAGIISRGVADLWNYGSGGTSLSPYFIQRATQLSYKKPPLMLTPDGGAVEGDVANQDDVDNIFKDDFSIDDNDVMYEDIDEMFNN